MSGQSAVLSSATQHAMLPEFGRKWETECHNTRCPLPTLLCAGYSVKLIFFLTLLKLNFPVTDKMEERDKEEGAGVPDMTMMPQITEQAINDNLKRRYVHDLIYVSFKNIYIILRPSWRRGTMV